MAIWVLISYFKTGCANNLFFTHHKRLYTVFWDSTYQHNKEKTKRYEKLGKENKAKMLFRKNMMFFSHQYHPQKKHYIG
jgi:hypothetical protein